MDKGLQGKHDRDTPAFFDAEEDHRPLSASASSSVAKLLGAWIKSVFRAALFRYVTWVQSQKEMNSMKVQKETSFS